MTEERRIILDSLLAEAPVLFVAVLWTILAVMTNQSIIHRPNRISNPLSPLREEEGGRVDESPSESNQTFGLVTLSQK